MELDISIVNVSFELPYLSTNFQLNTKLSSSFLLLKLSFEIFPKFRVLLLFKALLTPALFYKILNDVFSCFDLCKRFANEPSLFNGKSFSRALIVWSV
jgi:hypothetical protein